MREHPPADLAQRDRLARGGRQPLPLRALVVVRVRDDEAAARRLLAAGDPKREVWFAWNAKEVVRQIYDHTNEQLAAACERALILKACNYRSVRALIVTPSTESGDTRQLSLVHENVRGPEYFH